MSIAPDEHLPSYAERAKLLRHLQRLKMTRSAHAYVRGSTAKFYEWLDASAGKVPEGPAIWICGDCHSGNLGPLADSKGKVAIQIRDFDQTVIGNPAHDLIRLGLSLATAARGSNLPGVTTALMVEQMVEGYEAGLRGSDRHPGRADRIPKEVRRVLRQSLRRRWKDLARERIDDPRPTIPMGKRFWPLTERERGAIRLLANGEGFRRLVTLVHSRRDDAEVEVLDGAYWMKGCSSLGRLRYAILAGLKDADGTTETCLIDIKESVVAAAPRARGIAMPKSEAARVVRGARALSPFLGERMLAGRLLERPVVMRELTPQDLKLEIETLSRLEAVRAAHYLASVVGRAHARQMPPDIRGAWLKELGRNRSATLDAPSWLWASLVELVMTHEAAYLEHCRLYAQELGAAA
jgi:uncharacterized protein (DUF2252 family)